MLPLEIESRAADDQQKRKKCAESRPENVRNEKYDERMDVKESVLM